ncbi:hypothetical protein [Streptosporangium sp. CA-115845]|uniref:hypothetical protein n=1 Tax=Streptosporangium sp. CA-115845 TaxID=3240071 RepID=UPI003D8C910F
MQQLVDALPKESRRHGYGQDMSNNKPTPWDASAKARIMSNTAKHPNSPSAQSGLSRKAQSGADKNAHRQGGKHR